MATGKRVRRLAPRHVPHSVRSLSVQGKRLGKYEILAPIGVGGMGEVYRGRFVGPGGATKEVALKVISPDLEQDEHFLLMFLEEMRVAMAMTHRNIVQTFDAGQQGQTHYLVMELVDGCSLRQLLGLLARERGRLPIGLALFIGMEVCAGLAYAHSFRVSAEGPAGVVHRDVSPGNILLAAHGDVKLADFGVVRAAGRLAVTRATMIKGKLDYMAPEQARGEVEARSDLFSLGAVLFELFARRPFRREATLEDVRSGKLPAADLRRLCPDLPHTLDASIRGCLAPDPDDRPPTAGALREVLAEELHGVQQQQGSLRDPHAALRDFLSGRLNVVGPSSVSAVDQPRVRARRLAGAVLQQALEVPTDRGTGVAAPADGVAPGTESKVLALLAGDVTDGDSVSVSEAEGQAPGGPGERESHSEWFDADPGEEAPPSSVRLLVGAWRPVALLVLLFSAAVLIGVWLTRSAPPPALAPKEAASANPSAQDRLAAVTPARSDAHPPPNDAATVAVDGGQSVGVAAGRGTVADAAPQSRVDAGVPPRPVVRRPRRARRRTPRRAPRRAGRQSRASARLDINAVPWAFVYVDGRYRGETPSQNIQLSAGVHRIRLVNRKRRLAKSFSIRLRPGQHLRRVVYLE